MVRFTMEKNKIRLNIGTPAIIPDFTVDTCPFGCATECERIWINNVTGHRIICTCKVCHENEKEALDYKIRDATKGVGFTRPQHQHRSNSACQRRNRRNLHDCHRIR
jgi:hypothetical protein